MVKIVCEDHLIGYLVLLCELGIQRFRIFYVGMAYGEGCVNMAVSSVCVFNCHLIENLVLYFEGDAVSLLF